MRTSIQLDAILMFAFATAVVAQTSEKNLVRVPLEKYIKGHKTGD